MFMKRVKSVAECIKELPEYNNFLEHKPTTESRHGDGI